MATILIQHLNNIYVFCGLTSGHILDFVEVAKEL